MNCKECDYEDWCLDEDIEPDTEACVKSRLDRGMIQEMVKKYAALENEIMLALAEFKHDGDECRCHNRNLFYYVHFGSICNSVETVCLNCGGYVDDKE